MRVGSLSLIRSQVNAGNSTAVAVGATHLVVLDANQLAALRAAVVRLAAELRPGKGATCAGVTPRWYRDKVAQLDALRERLTAAEAAGVIA